MIASSNSVVACSPFTELTNELEWCGHNLLPLGNNSRKESSGTGSRKYDFVTGGHSSFNVLRSAQEGSDTLSNADSSMSVISSDYWKNDNTTVDISVASQTVHERDKASAPHLYSRESGGIELPSWNFSRNIRCIKYDALSEVDTPFTFDQTVEQEFERHYTTGSGLVEIKVEVDPNLYVNCDTSVDDTWSGFCLNNTLCTKPSVMLSKSHSVVNNEQSIDVHGSDNKGFDITSYRYNVSNGQGQVTDTSNLKQLVESGLDDKQKSVDCEESGSEISESNNDGSEFCIETCQVEGSDDNSDLRRSCSAEEQLDMQLSEFYKFQCGKCSKRQTFSNFRLLNQHCRDKHQEKGCVSCCDQILWEQDELVDHMLDHQDSYRWNKYTVAFM